MIFTLALISSVFASEWNKTVTENGIPAYTDMHSTSYVPLAARQKNQKAGLFKREDALTWGATFSEAAVAASSYKHERTTCFYTCEINHELNDSVFSNVIDQLNSKCTDRGCLSDFEIDASGQKFKVSVNAKYTSNKSHYIEAIKTLVQEQTREAYSNYLYKEYTHRGACLRECASKYEAITSRRFSFALYYPVSSDPTSGGIHSWMDVDFVPVEALTGTGGKCLDAANTIALLTGLALKYFGAAVAEVAPVICSIFE